MQSSLRLTMSATASEVSSCTSPSSSPETSTGTPNSSQSTSCSNHWEPSPTPICTISLHKAKSRDDVSSSKVIASSTVPKCAVWEPSPGPICTISSKQIASDTVTSSTTATQTPKSISSASNSWKPSPPPISSAANSWNPSPPPILFQPDNDIQSSSFLELETPSIPAGQNRSISELIKQSPWRNDKLDFFNPDYKRIRIRPKPVKLSSSSKRLKGTLKKLKVNHKMDEL
ncbi:uncharacterized protein MELLADRAFT_77017 [Melampsora larici-populina 98AG31]|uniref:Uncharacterized protein n=1 Tax=Melampsora larici-populina (strain 98AG31 / pathotype 3-4-7) TaxID=747676 RepID=F4RCF6_MELLP|nr:uncharacterized protein MELLADRAFT_77017 [Melampsora larici-populina 98AG31]EGG09970.1 hypothetical protein MELLADRAFT_77017 [Melampsora larici-populina 98AG31]